MGWKSRCLPLMAALALVACGGSKDGESTAASADGERKQALGAFPATPVPADAGSKGMWGPLYKWPLVAVHTVLLPDARVLSYGSQADGTATGLFSVDVWDSSAKPDAGHISIVNPTGNDLFCSSQLLLPPASPTAAPSVFMAGGDTWNGTSVTNLPNNRSALFSVTGNSVSRGNDMGSNRWYSTSTTLSNGEIYVQGGTGGTERPVVRDAGGTFRTLGTADTSGLHAYYPRNFVMPDGRLFGFDANGTMYFVATEGSGSVTGAGRIGYQFTGVDSSTAMFRPGRILQFGGESNGAVVVDVTSGNPVLTPTQSLSSQRRLVTATVLANGDVLATGGSTVTRQAIGVNTVAEMWNPVSGQWTQGAAADRPGLYHSNALMLADASVLVTTGGAPAPDGVDSADQRAQIYYPPYLFTTDGKRAPRPAISASTDWLEIGKTFSVQTAGTRPISRVTLVKTGSATHGFNMDQRFIELSFVRTAAAGGDTLAVQAPARAGEATPGYYLLFVFDDAGVPSEARILRMAVAANPNPAVVPAISNPGNREAQVGDAQSLAILATDPNGDTLRFSATGLPTGLSLDRATGRITGTPTAPGSFNATVSASDGVNSTSTSFLWTVTGAMPLTLTQEPRPNASVTGTAATFTATASGNGVQFQWNFGDGSGDTLWLSTSTTTKVYANPGTYVVTFRARDASGALVSRSFLQTVYLPPTVNQPTASNNLLIESNPAGNPRLWVVNQDNDSITAFDTVTQVRLGEVAVGSAPRSMARASNGLLWVTNKASASISVVDPATRLVTRTLALPRASQPFGIAMSPNSAQAFVTLEATGELLRFDTNSFAQTGSLALGPNIRQLSVTADGSSVLVSRFITRPLPGEGTAVVNTGAGQGGEVLQVAAASMTLLRTIVLAHSDKADSENQGSGLPNYLGAATISPDGSQAYVPGKQDNIKRGSLRNGSALNFQSTVRAISSRIALVSGSVPAEDLARRIDHDNASMVNAVAFDRRGALLFAALETSREVAVVDAFSGREVFRFDVGRAPQGLVLSEDGNRLYVNNFMDRSVGVYDLRQVLGQGQNSVPLVATLSAVATEKLAPAVLTGKQLFYDARDSRLARDRYMSCASCHNDGGQDGRVWDFSGQGEGLRNTISLRGRAGSQGRLHWSANFDEVQDFEGQIRALAGGTGLMTDTQFNSGTRSAPLGDRKAGISADLDALAAYVTSLSKFDASPARLPDGSLTANAAAGKAVFAAQCASCHAGSDFSDSSNKVLHDVGTLNAASGKRLGQTLNGTDAPTLRDAWSTAPYLHNGSAPTLEAAINAHSGITLNAADLAAVVSFTRQIGGEETAAPASSANLVVRSFASLMDKIGALYEVRVNSRVVGAGQLDAETWVDLFFNVATLVKDAVVEIVFRNDAGSASEDRNMVVDSIKVNGTSTIASTSSGVVLDQGSGALAFDNRDTVPASSTGGWMPWNSAMRFILPATGNTSSVTVRGAATLAAGVGAQMELRINGVLVGTRVITNTVVQDLVFPTPAVQIGDRIDVVFTNDLFANGEDRNLYIESVTARGVVLLSTANEAVIDAGGGPMAFDGLDTVPGRTFGGWIPWNGALRLLAK